jgi:hypothetical protein
MLEAGGVAPYYDTNKPLEFSENGTDFINYNILLRETDKINDLAAGNGDWLEECEGKAVKILNPTKVFIPKKHRYRFIWMDRKAKHMAKSQYKYLKRNGKENVPDHRLVIGNAKEARVKGIAILRGYPHSELLIIGFQNMLKRPRLVSKLVSNFLEMNLNIEKMAAVVIKRPAHCLRVMLEEHIYV